ncbi:MAG: hypothetical protein CM1200mP1_03520 [Candidatus Neomarinimicrobiota bacterium]|nr:MAG: hypothetical protein CM1200mP1_03520 [Candidatus Neomarinimicrobiota bacterium]
MVTDNKSEEAQPKQETEEEEKLQEIDLQLPKAKLEE